MLLRETYSSRRFQIISLLIIIVLIKMFSLNSFWVEKYYALSFFPWFSHLLRIITGWLSISIGDLLYLFIGIWLLYKFIRFLISVILKKRKGKSLGKTAVTILVTGMFIYIIFNIFWGLNYNRKGIAYQLNLDTAKYTFTDLKRIEQLLLAKVNESKQALISKHQIYPGKKDLFLKARDCYKQIESTYPFLKYQKASTKSSLFSWWGNYLGFTGYYNPFSGEAQVNTTVPQFIQPYTTCHEIAHQLGYAKEDEANFVGYLSATNSTDTLFRYSAYLDLFLYANRQVFFIDSVSAKQKYLQLSPAVKADLKEWKEFLIRYRSPLDVFITWAYGKYLKANQQPNGMSTYNEVIADVIAFYKKTGKL